MHEQMRKSQKRPAVTRAGKPLVPGNLLQRLQETDHLPPLGFRKSTPRRHAIFLASVGEQPEELSRHGQFDALGMQIGPDAFAFLFAFGVRAMAWRAVLRKNFRAGGGSVRVGGKWVGPRAIFGWDLAQPLAVSRPRKNSS